MQFISHRVNFLDAKQSLEIFSSCDGIEFDIRDQGNIIVVQHDPFKDGQDFSEFLKYCPADKLYIVNVKAEGIEEDAIAMLEAAGIRNFFLLDCSIPSIMRLNKAGETRIAVRFSEVESAESVFFFAQKAKVQWVWVDCFTSLGALSPFVAAAFQTFGLKICLVSPDLQGRPEEVEAYAEGLKQQGISVDAVCAKSWNLDHWRRSFSLSQEQSSRT